MFRSKRVAFLSLSAVGLLLAAVGCSDPVEEKVLALADASGAASSANASLRTLIASVDQNRGLPAQLDPPIGPPSDNAAAALAECYSGQLHLRLAPVVTPLVDPVTDPTSRRKFLERHELLVQKTADAIDLPRWQFEVGHAYGFFARMRYLDDASLAVKLMLVRAQHRAAIADAGEGAGSLADLFRALRVCHRLSKIKRIEARVMAATLRDNTLNVAAAPFEQGLFRRAEADQLYSKLRDYLVDWPTDDRMLVGERATVIHAYEAVRAGMIERLVTLEERRDLRTSGRLEGLELAAPDVVDADEARYLRAMGRLIVAADQPFHARGEEISAALDEINTAPTGFAATLFVDDLTQALRIAAEDRAFVEAWTIALAAAADLRTPPFRESPVSGEPYEVSTEGGRVEVSSAGELQVSLPVMQL